MLEQAQQRMDDKKWFELKDFYRAKDSNAAI